MAGITHQLKRWTAPQDLVWVLLFATLMAMSPSGEALEAGLLALLAVAQVLEPKLKFLEATRGKVLWILVKLALGYLLIGYTGGLTSSYYLVLLLPVVSAATALGVAGTLLFTLIAAGSYLSFLLFIDWTRYSIAPEQMRELALRVAFLAMAGNLTNMLAQAVRVQSGNFRALAERLAKVNQDLREAEAAVRRSERLAALGQLSAGLAHELRNPLGTIRTSAEMLGRSVQAENEISREVAGFISSEVDRANSLVTRFLEFARPLELRRAPAELAALIDRAVAQVEREPEAEAVSIYKNYAPGIPPLPLDAELMERAFFNLLLNAVQATGPRRPGGAITVKTRLASLGAGGELEVAEVAIIDRGCGIQAAELENIFNPFFTTKPRGVGLGLAIVAKILDEHGATMTVESEPGKGSVFRVWLPLKPQRPA